MASKRFSEFKKSKKAIAPLIATVLLIAFAVALGAVVMNWGKSYVESTQKLAERQSSGQIECTNEVDFEILKVRYDSNNPLNETPDSLEIVVENLKDKEIYGMSFKLIGDNGNGFTVQPTVQGAVDELNDLKEKGNTSADSFQIRTINIHDLYNNSENYVNQLTSVGDTHLKQIKVVPYILPNDDRDNDIIACDGRTRTTEYGDNAWPDEKAFFTSGD